MTLENKHCPSFNVYYLKEEYCVPVHSVLSVPIPNVMLPNTTKESKNCKGGKDLISSYLTLHNTKKENLEMSIRTGIVCQIFVLSLILASSVNVYSLECEDDRCKTGLCNSTGSCICNFPDHSTILNGDRTFLGGKFCDEEMTMCDGTNSFWCEHGGACEEIVQGEKYSCKCLSGFSGEHCEHSGSPCGQIFCFHNAECNAEAGYVCQCPPDWKGSDDCSVSSTSSDFYSNSSSTELPKVTRNSDKNRTVAFLAISSVGTVAAGAIYGKKVFSKKKRDPVKFQQLSEMHAQGILDDDDVDDDENLSMVPKRVHGSDVSQI